ncbi:MAG: hypothetical protein GWO24_09290, partial [Akkermansiaceae bacterium]|nr:hypothetical protein [Akkermansiaceae bacterium]
IAILSSSASLAGRGSRFFLFATIAQCGFYLLGLVGTTAPRMTWKCFSLPAAFLFLNSLTLLGLYDYCRRRNEGGW